MINAKVVLILFLLLFVVVGRAEALLESTPNHPFKAKVERIISDEHYKYLKVSYIGQSIWLKILKEDAKSVSGSNTYSFYMPFLVESNVRVDGTKYLLNTVWHTLGVVNKKYSEGDFGFKECKLGEDLASVRPKLQTSHKVIDDTGGLLIKDFNLGGIVSEVRFSFDTYNKLASLRFEVDATRLSEAERMYVICTFSNIFNQKFGRSDWCEPTLDFDREKFIYCSWKRGEVEMFTSSERKKEGHTIRAVVTSSSRLLRAFNIHGERIEQGEKNIRKDIQEVTDEIAREAANQF